jgi:hypothetical protein
VTGFVPGPEMTDDDWADVLGPHLEPPTAEQEARSMIAVRHLTGWGNHDGALDEAYAVLAAATD